MWQAFRNAFHCNSFAMTSSHHLVEWLYEPMEHAAGSPQYSAMHLLTSQRFSKFVAQYLDDAVHRYGSHRPMPTVLVVTTNQIAPLPTPGMVLWKIADKSSRAGHRQRNSHSRLALTPLRHRSERSHQRHYAKQLQAVQIAVVQRLSRRILPAATILLCTNLLHG